MPRMNGYQFCRELRVAPEHKALPVVLMSAKGDKIRGQFVQQTGAVDAITKPFDARGLVAVIEGALKKTRRGAFASGARRRDDARRGRDRREHPAAQLLLERRSRAATGCRPRASSAGRSPSSWSRSWSRCAASPSDAGERVGEAIQRAITPESMSALGVLLRTLNFGEGSQEVLSGDISVISIAEILQLCSCSARPGRSTSSTRNREITMYVREGTIDLATVHGLRDEFLIGRYLIELGVVTRTELNTVVKNRAGSKRLLGEMLINLGMVGDEQVEKALVRQTSELVYEVVRWKNGRFTFSAGASSPAATKAKLGLASGGLVMEGFRRVDEWRLIEGSFDFEEVLFRDQVAIAAQRRRLEAHQDRARGAGGDRRRADGSRNRRSHGRKLVRSLQDSVSVPELAPGAAAGGVMPETPGSPPVGFGSDRAAGVVVEYDQRALFRSGKRRPTHRAKTGGVARTRHRDRHRPRHR